MRVIKFRAWLEDEMLSHENLVYKDQETHAMYTIITDEEREDGIHFMQYTGLKDKNGCEIYEGDIVRFKHEKSSDYEVSVVVYFGDDEWQYPTFDLDAGYLNSHFESHVLQTIICTGEYDFEVIGNIYEHLHLLIGREAQ